jgi:hypothetical protein
VLQSSKDCVSSVFSSVTGAPINSIQVG